jgi:hypothetical protein
MNKYTARGLALSAVLDENHVVVVAASAAGVAQAFREMQAVASYLNIDVSRVRAAYGMEAIEFSGGARIRFVQRAQSGALRGGEDVVYFDYEPSPDEVASVIGATALRGLPAEVVSPV